MLRLEKGGLLYTHPNTVNTIQAAVTLASKCTLQNKLSINIICRQKQAIIQMNKNSLITIQQNINNDTSKINQN